MRTTEKGYINLVDPLTPTVAIYGYNYLCVPDRVNPSFIIFDIRAPKRQSALMSKIINGGLTRSVLIWHINSGRQRV